MAVHVDASEYQRLATHLKQADRRFRTAFNKRLRVAVKGEMQTVAEEGAEPMPSSGGFEAHLLAKAKPNLRTQGTSGIVMVFSSNGKGKPDIGSLNNRGRLRHPLFGMRRADTSTFRKRLGLVVARARGREKQYWFNQAVPSGTWDDAFEASGEPIKRKVAEAFDELAKGIPG